MKPLNNCFPLLVTKDLKKSVAWYKSKLGFKAEFEDYKTWCYASLKKGNIGLMFHGTEALDDKKYRATVKKQKVRGTGVIHYMEVPDVDKLYKDVVKGKRVKAVWDIKDQPWGARTFTVADPDGYLLTFMTSKPMPGHGECCDEKEGYKHGECCDEKDGHKH